MRYYLTIFALAATLTVAQTITVKPAPGAVKPQTIPAPTTPVPAIETGPPAPIDDAAQDAQEAKDAREAAARAKALGIEPDPATLIVPTGKPPLQIAANAQEIIVGQKYWIGGIPDVPGTILRPYYTDCAGKQIIKTCSKLKAIFGCQPTLYCGSKPYWNAKKGLLK